MTVTDRPSPLAPFRVRSFRFQWPADLCTSFSFEMENLILSWYILIETGSVLMLTLFASLQYIGTLFAPMFGVIGDRIGHKRLLCAMRAFYVTMAAGLLMLALTKLLAPLHVFVIATLMGIVRPSDLVMRYSLIGQSMPPDQLVSATSVSRTTQDSARIMGALSGAGLVAALGMGAAYGAISALYLTSFALTLGVAKAPARRMTSSGAQSHAIPPSPWRDLKDGVVYVVQRPQLAAAMVLAFLVNLCAFPLTLGLMPIVAKEIYGTGQTGLGQLVASFAFGALLGSLTLSRYGAVIRPARTMIICCLLWYTMLLIFAQMPGPSSGIPMLILAGLAQSLGMIPMSAMLLRTAGERFRGRVMGIRTLAIYGVPIGLLIAGPLITQYGYRVTASAYCVFGLICTALIAAYWRTHVWALDAAGNKR
jgi:MFS family permease